MRVTTVRNVCQALTSGVNLLLSWGEQQDTRNGPAWVAPFPVMTVTQQPTERVLFTQWRNANPFFHLFEAIWMLAGRDDCATLNAFVKDFGRRYGEEDGTMHGAYGWRWRSAFQIDQLDYVVERLRKEPDSRQCVLQMWDSSPVSSDLNGGWKDKPCNTHIYLRINHNSLDLTACCRSNDAIWGAHGANAVHFSILQEYLAARIGVNVGYMYQLSNNYHGYLREMDKLIEHELQDDRYTSGAVAPLVMFDVPERIDHDVHLFMRCYEDRQIPENTPFANIWFQKVLVWAMLAHHTYKMGNINAALAVAEQIAASDWRVACVEWLQRRQKAAIHDNKGPGLSQ